MSLRLKDSFDGYSTVSGMSDPVLYGEWSSGGGGNMQASTALSRLPGGRSLQTSTAGIAKTSMSNSSATIFAACAFYNTTLSGSSATIIQQMQFLQGGTTVQIQILFRGDGAIEFRRGGSYNSSVGGTTIATYTGAHIAAAWNQFQFKVVINGSTGEVHVRKNGNLVDDFAATSLNTQSTANSYSDGVYIGSNGGQTGNFDDFYHNDDTGTDNNTWPGDIRAYFFTPNGNSSVAFTPNMTTASYTNGGTGSSASRTSNTVWLTPITISKSGTITGATFHTAAGFTGHALVGIYSDAAGLPSSLVASAPVVTNPVTGINTVTLSSGLAVTAGSQYWVGVLADLTYSSGFGVGVGSYTFSQAYASGLPSSIVAPTSTGSTVYAGVIMGSISNATLAADNPNDGDTSFNYSSTVGQQDLFTFPPLTVTPAYILAVANRTIWRKSDAGSRSGQTAFKSGASTELGSSIAFSTTYTGTTATYTTDPNTSAAWTVSGVNAINSGYKLAA